MRDLIYRLADGTEVKTMNEAKASGQTYKEIVRDTPIEAPKNLSKKLIRAKIDFS